MEQLKSVQNNSFVSRPSRPSRGLSFCYDQMVSSIISVCIRKTPIATLFYLNISMPVLVPGCPVITVAVLSVHPSHHYHSLSSFSTLCSSFACKATSGVPVKSGLIMCTKKLVIFGV